MPQISRFRGISIYMYYEDHEPPHFHAFYGEYEVVVTISDGAVYAGGMPTGELAIILSGLQFGENWQLTTG
ncbi:MAG TPA: DUF4160 domain-containing protein [Fimbriimonadaceae bacterium]